MSKIALVTGAALRVGKYIAERLAKDGWSIALHYNTSEKEAYELAQYLLPIGNVMLFQADLTDHAQAKNLILEINKQLGPISLLINNASIYKNDNLNNLDTKDLEKNFAIHVNSVIYLAQGMARQEINGDIINIIDSDISHDLEKFFSYLLSKKTLLSLTSMLAMSLAPNIKVNAISPGPLLFKDGQNLKIFNELILTSPLRKSTSLEELYDTIDFLVKSCSITGQNIYLDGGRYLI